MTEEAQDEHCKEAILASVASLYQDEKGFIKWSTIEKVFEEEGLDLENDPRTKRMLLRLSQMKRDMCKDNIQLSICELKQVLAEEESFLLQALLRSLIISDFRDFACSIKHIYESVQECSSGEIARKGDIYEVFGDEWCVSVVTIDGQKVSFGFKSHFTLDEICGPLIHGLAIDILGLEKVNALPQEITQSPPSHYRHDSSHDGGTHLSWFLSDVAAILMCSKIKAANIKKWTQPMKHDYVLSYLKGLCCGEELRFSNASYSQAKESNCSAIAAAHFLRAFAKTKPLIPHIDSGLDLFLQLKSMEVTTDSLATIGAVLANGGVSPFDGQEILSEKAVSGLLNAMYSGGFGKKTSMFAVQGGVPGLCTDSGAILIVVPGVLGLGLYSPRVECCCSVRGYNFAIELIKYYRFHPYTNLEERVNLPKDGKIKKNIVYETDPLWPIFIAASKGDQEKIKKCTNNGLDLMTVRDPSGLTLLHVAAAYGHLDLVNLLFCKAPDLLFTCDFWCRKPSDYAKATGQKEVFEYLEKLEKMTRTSLMANTLEPEG